MKYTREEVGNLELTPIGQKEHDLITVKFNELCEQSDRLEKQYEEWQRENEIVLNDVNASRCQKRKLDRERMKFKKKLSAIASKLEDLLIKNEDLIEQEVMRHRKINS